jgi:hypothetical protein
MKHLCDKYDIPTAKVCVFLFWISSNISIINRCSIGMIFLCFIFSCIVSYNKLVCSFPLILLSTRTMFG